MFGRSCIFLFCSLPVAVLSVVFGSFRWNVFHYIRSSEFTGRRCVFWKVIPVRGGKFVCPRRFWFWSTINWKNWGRKAFFQSNDDCVSLEILTGCGFIPGFVNFFYRAFKPDSRRRSRVLNLKIPFIFRILKAFGRGDRAVECTALEMLRTRKRTEGSNPSLSAREGIRKSNPISIVRCIFKPDLS